MRWLCGFALSCGFLAASPALASDDGPSVITIHIVNNSSADADDLRRARGTVVYAFERIGVHAIWTEDKGLMDPASPTREVAVVLLSPEMTARKLTDPDTRERTLGSAVIAASRAYAFFGNIERIAVRAGVPVGTPLGQVIVHEVGHILLRHGHSELGIMRRNLPRQGIAVFDQFTRAQGSRLRTLLRVPAGGRLPVVQTAN
jgi:hypothetical protein